MIDISPMSADDLNSIIPYLQSDYDEFWNENILKSEFENKFSTYIVAKENSKILGFAGIIDTIDSFEITNIVVKKSRRHEGIGNILLNALIDIAKSKNKSQFFLEVNVNNLYAISLYEKNGFEKCGLRKKYYNNTDDAILMNLKIK